MSIPFIDLKAQRARIRDRLDARIATVLDHGNYILGPEVAELESRLAVFAGTRHCLTCSNGTDALALILTAWGIGPGDAVFVPAFTFVATAEPVVWNGATLVFVDVERDSFNLDPASLEAAIVWAKKNSLAPKAVIAVDLFGQAADYRRIVPIARTHGLKVLADSAQGFGSTIDGKPASCFADATSTSFFPAKPLGCYGDGGAVLTDDTGLFEVVKSLRVHGQGNGKYDNVRVGMNARLDTIQAAVLLEKLAIFRDEIAARDRIARRYNSLFGNAVATPSLAPGITSVWAQYTIRIENRDRVAAHCKKEGIPTAIYYPIPMPLQEAYKGYPMAPGGMPVAEALASQVLSLPMHPYLDDATQDRIVATVRAAC